MRLKRNLPAPHGIPGTRKTSDCFLKILVPRSHGSIARKDMSALYECFALLFLPLRRGGWQRMRSCHLSFQARRQNVSLASLPQVRPIYEGPEIPIMLHHAGGYIDMTISSDFGRPTTNLSQKSRTFISFVVFSKKSVCPGPRFHKESQPLLP